MEEYVMLIVALVINLIILICEIYVLIKVRRKRNIFKYYTFLQNFLTTIVSSIFIVYLILNILFSHQITEYIKGMRYVSSCGLITTTIIYVLFLSSNNKNMLSNEDFVKLNPKIANVLLHYLCPVLSLLSFIIFEREITLTNSIWTGLAALPSGLYWLVYLILSLTKLWEEPYDLTSKRTGVKGLLLEIFTLILIPIIFMFVSFLLWEIK
jgi:hypothetical protein